MSMWRPYAPSEVPLQKMSDCSFETTSNFTNQGKTVTLITQTYLVFL